MRSCRRLMGGLVAALCVLTRAPPAASAVRLLTAEGAEACAAAIAAVEPGSGIPPGLLRAIALVESGRRDPDSGAAAPWPWTADIEGAGSFFPDKPAAIAAVQAAQRDGARSIDVGCMQVNLLHHPDAFPTLERAFDPLANVAYAAHLLRDLYSQTGDWGRAAALYHSATPALGAEYQRKVMAAWRGGAPGSLAALPAAFLPAPPGGGLAASPFGTGGGLAGLRGRAVERVAATASQGAPHGRDLASYRAMPIRTAFAPAAAIVRWRR
ncbi:MAG TPA: lytic transglycosylase domain-containing protein [Acetobacteraceae bacterium]|nr:lytic transglycosylase domain-containing protein [Acetobacteraceae bacterium]